MGVLDIDIQGRRHAGGINGRPLPWVGHDSERGLGCVYSRGLARRAWFNVAGA